MIYLADTNILLRFGDKRQPAYVLIRSAVQKLIVGQHQVVTASQNFIEFWNVATRPVDRNGLGYPSKDISSLLQSVEDTFVRLPDTNAVYPEWRKLVVKYKIAGVKVHDARLVAVMKVHHITHVLTLNAADFSRYASEGIVAVEPSLI